MKTLNFTIYPITKYTEFYENFLTEPESRKALRFSLSENHYPAYIPDASSTLTAIPANVAKSAPASVYLVFLIFAVIKYTDIV